MSTYRTNGTCPTFDTRPHAQPVFVTRCDEALVKRVIEIKRQREADAVRMVQ